MLVTHKRMTLGLLVGLLLMGVSAAQADDWGIDLDCTEQTTAYKAAVHGALRTSARNSVGDFVLRGELDVSIREWDGEPQTGHIAVEGSVWKDGRSSELHALPPSSLAVRVLFVRFESGGYSSLRIDLPTAPSGDRDYWMDCNTSAVRLPQIKNLVISPWHSYAVVPPAPGSRFLNNALFVKNVGNQPITPGPIRVRVAGREIATQVYPRSYGIFSPPSEIAPDSEGVVVLNFAPGSVVQRCQTYEVDIDLDRQLQSGPAPGMDPTGAFSPFDDDSGTAASPCLTWTTPIDFFTLGAPLEFNLISDATLQEVVSSEVVARPVDRMLCWDCHVPSSVRRYRPPAGVISSTREIVGKSWAQPGGWAEGFIAQDGQPGEQNKPIDLRRAFRRWLDDGAR